MKYYKIDHFRKKDDTLDIYFKWYTTKSGKLKFLIEMYALQVYNENGFFTQIARYTTDDNALLRYIKMHDNFILLED